MAATIGIAVAAAVAAFVLGRWSRSAGGRTEEPADGRPPVAQSSHWHRSPGLRD